MTQTHSKVFTMEEAMTYLRTELQIKSRSTFYRFIKQGKLTGINLNEGGKYAVRRFPVEELDTLIAALKSEVIQDVPEK